MNFYASTQGSERELISQKQHSGAASTTDKVGIDEGSTIDPTTNISTPNANTDGLDAGQKMYSMLVENYDGDGNSSYFRMGYPDRSTWEDQAGTAGSDKGAGILMATHGSIKQKTYSNFFQWHIFQTGFEQQRQLQSRLCRQYEASRFN